jgi:hypothetical protein
MASQADGVAAEPGAEPVVDRTEPRDVGPVVAETTDASRDPQLPQNRSLERTAPPQRGHGEVVVGVI